MDFKNTPPWKNIRIPAADLPPGPDKLRRVIEELEVEKDLRYKAGPYGTYCNIFASDVITAMGFEPGHWVRKDGSTAPVEGHGQELRANDMLRWFERHGLAKGWVSADRAAALDAAARGHLVVVGWDSKKETPGHIAIVLPEGTIAQAGRTNFVGRTIAEGFGKLPVVFWVQIHGGRHSP